MERQRTSVIREKFPSSRGGNLTDRFGTPNRSFQGLGIKGFGSPGNEWCKYWKAALEGGDAGGLGDLGWDRTT